MKNILIALAAFALSSVALAGGHSGGSAASGLNWNYVDLGISVGDSDEYELSDGDTKGWSVSGVMEFADKYHLRASVGDLDLGGEEADITSIGIGTHTALSGSTDLVLDLIYSDIDAGDGCCVVEDGDSWTLGAGLRSIVFDNLELSAGVTYTDVDRDDEEGYKDIGFNVGALYSLSDTLGLGLQWSQMDAVETDDYGSVDMLSLYIRKNL